MRPHLARRLACTLALATLAVTLTTAAAEARRGRGRAGRHDEGHHRSSRSPFAGLEIEGRVVAADPEQRTLLLERGEVIVIAPETAFVPGGDLLSFEAIVQALAAGAWVRVEGAFAPGESGAFFALVLEAEVDD